MFRFYSPWDSSLQIDISLDNYLHKSVSERDHIYVDPNDHLYAGDQRLSFQRVDIVGSSSFPSKEEA